MTVASRNSSDLSKHMLQTQVDQLITQNKLLQSELSMLRQMAQEHSARTTAASDALTGGRVRTQTLPTENNDSPDVAERAALPAGQSRQNGLGWCCTASNVAAEASAGPQEGGFGREEHEIVYEEVHTGLLARAQRTADTLLVGARLHFSIQSLKTELEGLTLDEEEVQNRWDALHLENASMVLQHIMSHRGFFIKVGQKASTMKGILPAPWVETLEPLQDKLPVSSFVAVQQTILEDLGKPLQSIFSEFGAKPLASASIGQAHVAWLQDGGDKVCVKVEHPGVAELAATDLNTIEYLVSFLSRLHDEAPDVSEIVGEMKRASVEEVDFRLEAQNAMDAAATLLCHPEIRVRCPEPLMQYCGRRVLTMRFIEGWKITDTDRLPAGADREGLATEIVEAFALLVFQSGLIHGDPHPGNIFVEQFGEGGADVRPVLLDWGIVKRLDAQQRVVLAKWVVASLSRDRFLHLAALSEAGLEISESVDCAALDKFMFAGMLQLRDTVPAESMKHFQDQFRDQNKKERSKEKNKLQAEGKNLTKLIQKIPGWLHFFMRGLSMLQDVCSMLDVTVSVARLMLKYALPCLGKGAPLQEMSPARLHRPLEAAVLGKLHELRARDLLLGAQVAVLDHQDRFGGWLCDTAVGNLHHAGAPLVAGQCREASLIPLLELTTSVLTLCFLSAISQKTAAGKEVSLDSPVAKLWPEFGRGGKGGISIRQLLQHCGALTRPFRCKTTFKTFFNEKQMEEMLAAAPGDREKHCKVPACRVLGVALAALLRRATGHRCVAASLRQLLEPHGLHEDIAYSGKEDRMAHVGHKLQEEISVSTMWEMLEDRMERTDNDEQATPPWLNWQELSQAQPWCVDPLLVNSEALRSGKGCASGLGLRASATALCRIFCGGPVPTALLQDSLRPAPSRLHVESLEEWEALGRCLDVASGWQLLPFEDKKGGSQVQGFGHISGSTGSMLIRLPHVTIAVLLTSLDQAARRSAGAEILEIVTQHLGLRPLWLDDKPQVPERVPAAKPGNLAASQKADAAGMGEASDMRRVLERLEAQVARLTEALGSHATLSTDIETQSACATSGRWGSAEIDGLDDLLEVMNVPPPARALAKRMHRALDIDVQGAKISIQSTTSIAGRRVEESNLTFEVGTSFVGKHMGHSFQGMARWIGEVGDGSRVLVVEKQADMAGQKLTLVENFQVTEDGRLAVKTLLRGKGREDVTLTTSNEVRLLSMSLEPTSLRIKKEVEIGGTRIWRGGRIVGPEYISAFTDLECASIPLLLQLQYDDLESIIMFDREPGSRVPGLAMAAVAAKRCSATSQAPESATRTLQKSWQPQRDLVTAKPGASMCPLCCTGIQIAVASARQLLASAFYAIGRAVEGS
eukprot:TRINITY_DN31167_c0_g1_i1.p1 TRINITY_DN31167_c0_g1~~TRINITY_DN31167_c0_g1_i1.p1  ORF type:complete len:1371 (-),score=251.89 TRINITY_DN31167_c0_g1_i1:172-4284(-)